MTRLPSIHARQPAARGRAVWLAALAVATATVLAVLGFAPPAAAVDSPTSLGIEGPGLSHAITVRADQQQDLFSALLNQIAWMKGSAGDPMQPDTAKLGSKYRVVVYINDKATQTYDLYPQATGGPRAFRPGIQPASRTNDAWFYASLSLPGVLRAAGVPLAQPTASGVNGLAYADPGGVVPAGVTTSAPAFSLTDVLGSQRRTLLLWVATAFGVLLLVLLAAAWSRRYGR